MLSLRLSPSSKHVASVGANPRVQFFSKGRGETGGGRQTESHARTLGEIFCHTNGSVLRSVGVSWRLAVFSHQSQAGVAFCNTHAMHHRLVLPSGCFCGG